MSCDILAMADNAKTIDRLCHIRRAVSLIEAAWFADQVALLSDTQLEQPP